MVGRSARRRNGRRRGVLSLDRDPPAFDAAIVQKARTGSGTYTWELVTSRTPSALWEARYVYATGSAANAQAQSALYELCRSRS